jgi:biopolymer transport protein ExbD
MSPRRPRPPDEVFFPVVPMLDMAFQLLAFFIMTFQPPTSETRIDLDLPAAPSTRPLSDRDRPDAPDLVGRVTDLRIEARADPGGALHSLRLEQAELASPDALLGRLREYVAKAPGRPLRVALAAEDSLRYDEAARLIGVCSRAGASAVRLAVLPSGPHQGAPSP